MRIQLRIIGLIACFLALGASKNYTDDPNLTYIYDIEPQDFDAGYVDSLRESPWESLFNISKPLPQHQIHCPALSAISKQVTADPFGTTVLWFFDPTEIGPTETAALQFGLLVQEREMEALIRAAISDLIDDPVAIIVTEPERSPEIGRYVTCQYKLKKTLVDALATNPEYPTPSTTEISLNVKSACDPTNLPGFEQMPDITPLHTSEDFGEATSLIKYIKKCEPGTSAACEITCPIAN